MTGTIFDIKRFSIHDGPGIRTTVFLKGCPLRCVWCHNPESQSSGIHELFKPELCLKCDLCARQDCPAEARTMVGERIDTDALMARIVRDRFSYDESGGGVTFSGGEPLMQGEFLKDLLVRCRDEAVHAAVDTSGFASLRLLLEVAALANLFLFDIKLIDDSEHLTFTGVSNREILENLKALCNTNLPIEIRMPIIPGITDTDANVEGVALFLGRLKNCPRIRLLPHHHVAMAKYERFGIDCKLTKIVDPSEARMDALVAHFRARGVDAFR